MADRIAILGWGSLLWDLDDLAEHVHGDWMQRAGPRLPMEFSRISAKRKDGLVVCLDPKVGVPCATHAIVSRADRIATARADLARRERAPDHRVGWADISGRGESRMPEVIAQVAIWCEENGWAGAVWTDLEPNFELNTGQPFSVENGIAYLKTLSGENLTEALQYIRRAPPTTRTPLRRALSRDPWWRDLVEAYSERS